MFKREYKCVDCTFRYEKMTNRKVIYLLYSGVAMGGAILIGYFSSRHNIEEYLKKNKICLPIIQEEELDPK